MPMYKILHIPYLCEMENSVETQTHAYLFLGTDPSYEDCLAHRKQIPLEMLLLLILASFTVPLDHFLLY